MEGKYIILDAIKGKYFETDEGVQYFDSENDALNLCNERGFESVWIIKLIRNYRKLSCFVDKSSHHCTKPEKSIRCKECRHY